jgi:hypothetical protein
MKGNEAHTSLIKLQSQQLPRLSADSNNLSKWEKAEQERAIHFPISDGGFLGGIVEARPTARDDARDRLLSRGYAWPAAKCFFRATIEKAR